MEKRGYARCSDCGQLCAGYAPRGWTKGAPLHVWAHTPAQFQTGWGRQPKCSGSYKPGTDTRLTEELAGGQL